MHTESCIQTEKRSAVMKKAFAAAFPYTIPIFAGFWFLGLTYGIYMNVSGFSFWYPMLMSITIFAGSVEFVTVNMLLGAFNPLQALVMTLMINARHLFYGISLLDTYGDAGKAKPYLIFALTDETYSLVTQAQPPEGVSRRKYCLLVSFLDQCYWVVGSCLGALIGTYVPVSFEGVSFVLTALFVTLFVEQWLSHKEHFPAIVGVISTLLCLLIFGKDIFLIPSMVLMALLLTLRPKAKRRNAA